MAFCVHSRSAFVCRGTQAAQALNYVDLPPEAIVGAPTPLPTAPRPQQNYGVLPVTSPVTRRLASADACVTQPEFYDTSSSTPTPTSSTPAPQQMVLPNLSTPQTAAAAGQEVRRVARARVWRHVTARRRCAGVDCGCGGVGVVVDRFASTQRFNANSLEPTSGRRRCFDDGADDAIDSPLVRLWQTRRSCAAADVSLAKSALIVSEFLKPHTALVAQLRLALNVRQALAARCALTPTTNAHSLARRSECAV